MICTAAALVMALLGMAVLLVRPGRAGVWMLVTVAFGNVLLTVRECLMDAASRDAILPGYLELDPNARLYLVVVAAAFAGIALYVESRFSASPELGPHIDRFVGWSLIFTAAAELMLLSADSFLGWALLEATTFSAVPLILLKRGTSATSAAWKYFLFSSVGLSLTLLGFVLLSRSEMSNSEDSAAWLRIGASLIVIGYGTKLGLAPLYSWLPETYDSAPPATTALLASIQATCATVALSRAIAAFPDSVSVITRYELLAIGLASTVIGLANIVATDNFKKLLAYASITHAGVVALGLGAGKAAAYGVVLYVVSNAFVKAVLFLSAGHIKSAFRTKRIGELTGLIHEMPYSGLLLMLGTFALLGFAPFGSFWGELLIFAGLIEGGHFAVFAAAAAILAVTFVATGRSFFPMIWGQGTRKPNKNRESRASVYASFVFLAILLTIGIYVPERINTAFLRVASQINGIPR